MHKKTPSVKPPRMRSRKHRESTMFLPGAARGGPPGAAKGGAPEPVPEPRPLSQTSSQESEYRVWPRITLAVFT